MSNNYPRYTAAVRFFHWVNAITVLVLIWSGPPGSLYLADLRSVLPVSDFASLHDLSFWHLLQEYPAAQGWAVGIEPERVDWGLELSPRVAAAVPQAVDLICRLIS